MSYRGDIRLGDTIDIKFCTVTTTGAPTQLAGTPVISAYPDNSVTQLTAGITLTVDFDGVTGLNNVRVVATSGNGYATATNYDLVITTGTVGGTSVVGYVVGAFSIEKRSAVMPTTAARTLDVSAGGEAGVDWANVGSPTTTVGLSGTTVSTATSVTNGVTVTTNNDKTGYGLSAAAVQAIWDALTSALTTVGSIGKLLVDNVNATVSSRLASASISLTGGAVTVGTNNDKTGYALTAAYDPAKTASQAGDAMALTAGERNSTADAILDRDMSTGTDSGSATVRTVRQALRFLRNKWTISAGTLTVSKEDDTTASWTGAVTTTAGNPVSEVDPASV